MTPFLTVSEYVSTNQVDINAGHITWPTESENSSRAGVCCRRDCRRRPCWLTRLLLRHVKVSGLQGVRGRQAVSVWAMPPPWPVTRSLLAGPSDVDRLTYLHQHSAYGGNLALSSAADPYCRGSPAPGGACRMSKSEYTPATHDRGAWGRVCV